MPSLRFILANPDTHRAALLQLNVEYMTWVLAEVEKITGTPAEEMLGMTVPQYVASVIDKVCGAPPPQGAFYLLEIDGVIAGMGGIRRVRDGVAEVKRIYVRPEHRGKQLGETILLRVLDDAKQFGYQHVLLDSGPFMQSAHKVYQAQGFVDCAAYAEAEVPAAWHAMWRFMVRSN